MRRWIVAALSIAIFVSLFAIARGDAPAGPDEPVGSTPSPGQPPGPSADSCSATTAVGEKPKQLAFEVRCSFEPFQVVVDPDHRVLAARQRALVEGGDPQGDPGQAFRCEARPQGGELSCTGQAENGATIRSTMQIAGDRCRTRTSFEITGGVDCDGGEACIELAVLDDAVDRRPSGC